MNNSNPYKWCITLGEWVSFVNSVLTVSESSVGVASSDPHQFPPFYGNRSDFSLIDIFLINKKLSKLQGEWNWPISYLSDSEPRERRL